jgi:hypothetical protein
MFGRFGHWNFVLLILARLRRVNFEFRASARPGATYLVQIAGLGI